MPPQLQDLLRRTREGLPRFIAEQEATRLGLSKQFAEALAPTPVVPIAPTIPPQPVPAIPDSITAEDFVPKADIDVAKPEPAPIPSVEDIVSASLKLTPQEEAFETEQERIRKLRLETAEEPEFRVEKEEEFRVAPAQQAVRDLTAQLTALQAEAKAIPSILQQEALGRGITAGGLAPIEAGRLRQAGIKALIISANLSAARGNLATAESQVERAVNAKFAPLKAELSALEKNAQSILDSPSATLAEKQRAETLKAKLKVREDAQKEQKDMVKSILDLSVKVSATGKATGAEIKQITDLAKVDEEGVVTIEDVNVANSLASKFLIKPETGQTEFERAFFRQFKRLPTLDELRAEEKKTTNKLTLSETKSLGLPTSLVGMSEEDIGQDLESSTPPQWFKNSLEEKLQASTTPETLSSAWQEFRKTATKKTTSTTGKTKLEELFERIQ